MKTKALKSGALLAVAAGFALIPSFSAMALEDGSIDYGGNVNQINEQSTTNVLVQATNDGGYVIAGVTGECERSGGGAEKVTKVSFNSCTCGAEPLLANTSRGGSVSLLENEPICGYVVKYKADGTKEWQTDLAMTSYPSTSLTYGYDYNEETGEKTPVYRDYVNVEPVQLKETSAGIGLMTKDSDYFLFDANSGNITKSYSHIVVNDNSEEECPSAPGGGVMDCEDSVSWNIPYWTNVNSDSSTTYYNNDEYALMKKTAASSESKINYDVYNSMGLPVATQDSIYTVECSRGDSCNVVKLDENFQNREVVNIPTEKDFYISGASDQLVVVTASEEKQDDETGDWMLDSLSAYVIKGTDIIAQRELNDLNYFYGSNDPDEETAQAVSELDAISALGFSASDLVETDNGVALAIYYGGEAEVIVYDKNLNQLNSVNLDMSSNGVLYNDLAFLRDGSLTAAGADTNTSDYYSIDGDQNGMHVHYASVITPNQSGTGTGSAAGINNPNTLDNTIVFGVGLIALLSTAGCAAKRLARRR